MKSRFVVWLFKTKLMSWLEDRLDLYLTIGVSSNYVLFYRTRNATTMVECAARINSRRNSIDSHLRVTRMALDGTFKTSTVKYSMYSALMKAVLCSNVISAK